MIYEMKVKDGCVVIRIKPEGRREQKAFAEGLKKAFGVKAQRKENDKV